MPDNPEFTAAQIRLRIQQALSDACRFWIMPIVMPVIEMELHRLQPVPARAALCVCMALAAHAEERIMTGDDALKRIQWIRNLLDECGLVYALSNDQNVEIIEMIVDGESGEDVNARINSFHPRTPETTAP